MSYKIYWEDEAVNDIHSFDELVRKRIIKKVRSIEENPFHFAERLVEYSLFKLRIGY